MNIITNLKDKKEINLKIKKSYGLCTKYTPLGLINLNDKILSEQLIEGLKELQANYIIQIDGRENEKISENIFVTGKINPNDLIGLDFIVCDDDIKNLNIFLENGITPIIIKNNYMCSILKEFNPLKNEGNAYLYENLNKWSIFYAIVRYLENFKFPQDNKNLVKNVLKI